MAELSFEKCFQKRDQGFLLGQDLRPHPPLAGVSRAHRARNPFRPRGRKSVQNSLKNSLRSLKTVSFETPEIVLRLFRTLFDPWAGRPKGRLSRRLFGVPGPEGPGDSCQGRVGSQDKILVYLRPTSVPFVICLGLPHHWSEEKKERKHELFGWIPGERTPGECQGKKKHKNKNKNKFPGMSRVWAGGKIRLCAFFRVIPYGGEATHKQNPPQNPGTIPWVFVYVLFLYVLFLCVLFLYVCFFRSQQWPLYQAEKVYVRLPSRVSTSKYRESPTKTCPDINFCGCALTGFENTFMAKTFPRGPCDRIKSILIEYLSPGLKFTISTEHSNLDRTLQPHCFYPRAVLVYRLGLDRKIRSTIDSSGFQLWRLRSNVSIFEPFGLGIFVTAGF